MIDTSALIHFGTIVFTTAASAIGVGIGQGLTSATAIEAMDEQPAARGDIAKTAILGMALIETAALLGVIVSIIVLLGTSAEHTIYTSLSEFGIAFSVGLSALVLGIISARPAQAACMSVARQPFLAQKIMRFMLVTLSLVQTPLIFGLIIAIFIKNQAAVAFSIGDGLRLIASGLTMGVGSIGPIVGLALLSQAACKSIGTNRNAYNTLLTFTLVGQAIIETPIIFALILSLMMLFMVSPLAEHQHLEGFAFFAASICFGLGTLGTGLSSGKVAATACEQIAEHPEQSGVISRLSMFAQGLIETSAIYAFIVALFLIFLRE
jgi:F-type H+-transporting ATPase subunit c